ncbi:MAG: hypothetical protein ACK5NA_06245 [Enterococcus sp.]
MRKNERNQKLLLFYWPSVLTIFLVWGFMFDDFERSWLVLVIGALFYGALWQILKKDD